MAGFQGGGRRDLAPAGPIDRSVGRLSDGGRGPGGKRWVAWRGQGSQVGEDAAEPATVAVVRDPTGKGPSGAGKPGQRRRHFGVLRHYGTLLRPTGVNPKIGPLDRSRELCNGFIKPFW